MWTIIITIAAAVTAVMMVIIIKSQGEGKKEVIGKGHSVWLGFYLNNNQSLQTTQ